MKSRVVYYEDEINDDFFTGKQYNKTKIDSNYVYIPKNIISRIINNIIYYIFSYPSLSFYMYVIQGVKIKGKNNLKGLKGGYMVVGNHTHYTDAYVVQLGISFPTKTYVIANANCVKIPIIGKLVKCLGGLPIPETFSSLKNFQQTVQNLLKNNKVVCVFPEAHIWPYYTGLRPFPISAFKMAASVEAPVVPIATVYKKRLFGKPRAVVYVGKPIYYNKNLSMTENAKICCNSSYNFVKSITDSPTNYQYIKYIKREKQ